MQAREPEGEEGEEEEEEGSVSSNESTSLLHGERVSEEC